MIKKIIIVAFKKEKNQKMNLKNVMGMILKFNKYLIMMFKIKELMLDFYFLKKAKKNINLKKL
jgi:hypothetical protein